jgi:hypothetical protein
MVSYAKDQAVVAKHPPRERASNSNGGKASVNEPSDHGGKASAKKRASTLSAAKHLPERGPKSQWRQSIRQGSIDRQASVREEDTTYGKASAAGAAITLSAAKHLPKRKASDNGDKASAQEIIDGHGSKASAKGESDSGKTSASNDASEVKCSRTDHCSETHKGTTGTIRSFPSNRRHEESEELQRG